MAKRKDGTEDKKPEKEKRLGTEEFESSFLAEIYHLFGADIGGVFGAIVLWRLHKSLQCIMVPNVDLDLILVSNYFSLQQIDRHFQPTQE